MSHSKDAKTFEQLVQKIAPRSKLLQTWPLQGGVSAQMTAIEIALPDGQTKKMIVRRHGEVDRSHNPHIAADEFKLLQILHAAGLAVATPYYLDQSGEIFSIPYLVLEYIEGNQDFAPANLTGAVLQLAETLAQIHRLDSSGLELSFLPRQGKGFGARPAKLDESLQEGRIRDVLEASWPLPQINEPVLLHGDFWPGNILWQDGQLAAVLDWEDAKSGDPLADVGNSRLEILWAFGVEAMHSFTNRYQAMMSAVDFTQLAYWDLCAALRPASRLSGWGLDGNTEKRMRAGHHWFVAQAFERLYKE